LSGSKANPGALGIATLVIHDRAGEGSGHPLDDQLTLGREQGRADLVLDDPGVSRSTPASRSTGARWWSRTSDPPTALRQR
jgi:hypothetical protein